MRLQMHPRKPAPRGRKDMYVGTSSKGAEPTWTELMARVACGLV